MKVWVVLAISETDPIKNSFAYVFSTREKAVSFVESRLEGRDVTWDGDATESGGILDASFQDKRGGWSAYQMYCAELDYDDAK